MSWSSDEVAILKDGIEACLTHEEIAGILGKSTTAISHKAKRMGFDAKPGRTQARRELAAKDRSYSLKMRRNSLIYARRWAAAARGVDNGNRFTQHGKTRLLNVIGQTGGSKCPDRSTTESAAQ